jgi:hypothetical protein
MPFPIRALQVDTAASSPPSSKPPVSGDSRPHLKSDWAALQSKPAIRNRFPLNVFSVDASEQWVATAEARIPKQLRSRIHLHHSTIRIDTFPRTHVPLLR